MGAAKTIIYDNWNDNVFYDLNEFVKKCSERRFAEASCNKIDTDFDLINCLLNNECFTYYLLSNNFKYSVLGDVISLIRVNPKPKMFGRRLTEVVVFNEKGLEYSLYPFKNVNGGLYGNSYNDEVVKERWEVKKAREIRDRERKNQVREVKLEKPVYECEISEKNRIKSLIMILDEKELIINYYGNNQLNDISISIPIV